MVDVEFALRFSLLDFFYLKFDCLKQRSKSSVLFNSGCISIFTIAHFSYLMPFKFPFTGEADSDTHSAYSDGYIIKSATVH